MGVVMNSKEVKMKNVEEPEHFYFAERKALRFAVALFSQTV